MNRQGAVDTARTGRAWGLPLLARELIESAARLRTYQVRVAYASILLIVCFIVLAAYTPRSRIATASRLGAGAPVLATLSGLQEFGLLLVLPILVCGCLTVEKERRTLDLLLVTKLSAGTIIVEKFLSRLVPALSFILLSMPILAFSYALGGISPENLVLALLELVLVSSRIAAVGVLCSAATRTTAQALMATYALILLFCIIEQSLVVLIVLALNNVPGLGMGPNILTLPVWQNVLSYEPGWFHLLRSNLILSSSDAIPFPLRLFYGTLPSLILSLLCLPVAAWLIVPPVRGWLGAYFRLRSLVADWSRKQHPERSDLDDNPIAWRDSPRGDITFWWIQRWYRTGLPVMAILFGLFIWFPRREDWQVVSMFVYFVLWLAVTIRLVSAAACLIVQERVQQTMDILRTTPIKSEDIIRQKMEGVLRLCRVVMIPLGTCAFLRWLSAPHPVYLVVSALMIFVYPRLFAWHALICGMRAKHSGEAIFRSIMFILLWYVGPYVLCFLFGIMASGAGGGDGIIFVITLIAAISPVTLLGVTEAFLFMFNSQYGGDAEFYGLYAFLLLMTVIFQGMRITVLKDWAVHEAESVLSGRPIFAEIESGLTYRTEIPPVAARDVTSEIQHTEDSKPS